MKTIRPHLLDRAAILLSGLCLVHCLAGALLVASLTLVGGWMSHEVHSIGLMLALPLAVVALWRGVQAHGRWGVVAVGVVGIALMSASLFPDHGDALEIWLSVTGVLVLAAAHFWNMRAARR
ncbi:MAG: MerC domain-containing protein [Polymorphobacter sp.]|uniref:MerC domain-containing protein n=1 Tax=Polymorphobacter sp. TaxID=1909290 RepID=UPI003A872778